MQRPVYFHSVDYGIKHVRCDFSLPLNRIHAVAAHVRTMAPVKLDSPVKVFFVSVEMGSREKAAMKVNKEKC